MNNKNNQWVGWGLGLVWALGSMTVSSDGHDTAEACDDKTPVIMVVAAGR